MVLTKWLKSLVQKHRGRAQGSKALQANLDWSLACSMLEVNSMFRGGLPLDEIDAQFAEVQQRWRVDDSLEQKQLYAHEEISTQLAVLFQHLADVDAGDLPHLPEMPKLPEQPTAAETPSMGPSSHTNPYMTLAFQMKALAADQREQATRAFKLGLTRRIGWSLWVGPSQAPTPDNKAGLFLQGAVPPGTVIGLYPGTSFNEDMQSRASDVGHWGNPEVSRVLVPRYDDALLDVWDGDGSDVNPYALGHYARHPPQKVEPNVMRLQFDFMDGDETRGDWIEFPKHLRPYIPNEWGANQTMSQTWFNSLLEQGVYRKGMVLITTRQVIDEEVFVDHRLNPYGGYPSWYTPIDPLADARVWSRLDSGRVEDDAEVTKEVKAVTGWSQLPTKQFPEVDERFKWRRLAADEEEAGDADEQLEAGGSAKRLTGDK